MKVLVTGSGGFLGKHIVFELQKLPINLFGISNRLDCDLRDLTAVKSRLQKIKPDVIIHLAASPDTKNNRFDSAFFNTISCTLNLLQALPASHKCLFIHVGSYKQYGDIPIPFQEKNILNPVGSYGLAKSISEMLIRYRENRNFRAVYLRLGPVFGPGQSINNLIPHTIYSIIKNETKKLVASNITWDPIYVTNVVEAISSCIFQEETWGETINISTGSPYTPKEVMQYIAQLMNVNSIEFGRYEDQNEIHPLPCLGNISRAAELMLWKPRISIQEGLRLTLDYVYANLYEFVFN